MITADKAQRLGDANAVCSEIGRLIYRVEIHAHSIDIRTPQPCYYCGNGFYKPIIDEGGRSNTGRDAVNNFGFRLVGNPRWLVYVCNYCANVQIFRPDYCDENNWEKKS